MIFKPKQLGGAALPKEILTDDKKSCVKFGPCGIGKKALYLNAHFIDRSVYLPISSVQRVFKRVAMSKGGFTGKGMFASVPYLVVQYDDGMQKQFSFKREEEVDRFLEYMEKNHPDIPRHSAQTERRLREKEAAEKKRYLKELTSQAQAAWDQLEDAKKRLCRVPEHTDRLARAAQNKRRNDQVNPAYKWVALVIVIAGAVALGYGIYAIAAHDKSGIYYTMFGLAGVFFFSGAQVLPTGKNNRKAIDREWEEAREAMKEIAGRDFPVPYMYAHPVVLERMIRIVREGRAQTAQEALEQLKTDLKNLNSSVQVEQEEYDEIILIKPMFLLCDYQ